MRDFPPITKILLAINILIFVANQFGALPFTIAFPGEYSLGTFLAHFSHAALFHLGSNIIGIVMVSPSLEQGLGAKKYLVLLLWLWLAQATIMPWVMTAPTLGFSGILLGLLTFLAIRLWIRTKHMPGATLGRDLLVLVGINVALPLFVPQISFIGHAIGALLGLIAISITEIIKRYQEN